MNRHLLTFITLFAVACWLFFSYAPGTVHFLPPINLPEQWSGWVLQRLVVASLVIFVVVQGVIVYSTLRLSHSKRSAAQDHGMELSLLAEFFWTALPLVMTLGLAVLGYATWASLSSA